MLCACMRVRVAVLLPCENPFLRSLSLIPYPFYLTSDLISIFICSISGRVLQAFEMFGSTCNLEDYLNLVVPATVALLETSAVRSVALRTLTRMCG